MNREQFVHQLARDIFVRVAVNSIPNYSAERSSQFADQAYVWAKAFLDRRIQEKEAQPSKERYHYSRPGQGDGWFVEAASDEEAIELALQQCDDVSCISDPGGFTIWARLSPTGPG